MKNTTQQLGRFALTSVALAALSLGPVDAWALGLGKLAVQSSLGETLRAEIDVTSLTPEEAGNLKVRIAPPESYRSLGVDYNSVLPSTQATLLKRADGRPFLRLTSDRVVQEPFVDVILELSWATGRLVREYTLLFDPPAPQAIGAAAAAAAAVPAPAVVTAPVFSAPAPVATAAARPARPSVPPAAPPAAPPPAAERMAKAPPETLAPASPAAANGDSYRVRAGDTLTRIAQRTRHQGVSLDQTLVSLYRGNPQAFIGENMNRLKAGALLKVATAEVAGAVDNAEARQVILAQSADFSSFRQRLASGAPTMVAESATRKDTGQVQASVDDRKDAAAMAPDKLTLSKGAVAAKPGASEVGISKEKEQQDAAARVAALSKNVEDLKKLSGATGATAAPDSPAPAPAPVPDLTVAAAPAPVASVPEAEPPVAEPAVTPPAPAPAPPVTAPKPADAQPAADEPGFVDALLEANPLYLALGAGAALALVGFGVYRMRRAKLDTGETSFLESRLQPDSFFGASGGQRIDTREAAGAPSSMSYSLSQLDAIGDVDPVAEADVYLAYGRDLQAEEILKEAMRSNPERMAIRTKLLEVYAKRRDTKGFEMLATQLFAVTRGAGEDWQKAQELGVSIDPDNPLYQPGGLPESGLSDETAPLAEALGPSTMPQSVFPPDSGFGDSQSDRTLPLSAPAPASRSTGDIDVDLDLDVAQSFGPPTQPPSLESFDFDSAPTPLSTQPSYTATPPAPSSSPGSKAPLEFDLSSISLDLDEPAKGAADSRPAALMDASADDDADDNADPLARKLELAEEFRQIGDAEGARDLLQEVAAKAEGSLKVKAQNMLNDLG